MSFVRPEVAQNLYRWREALVGAIIAVLGFWAAMEGFGFLAIVGAVLMVAGLQNLGPTPKVIWTRRLLH